MNFLLRPTHSIAPEITKTHEIHKGMQTLEELVSEDFSIKSSSEGYSEDDDGSQHRGYVVPEEKSREYTVAYSDVTKDDGWITIPFKELTDDWSTASDIKSFCSLDRPFLFPGEKLHILVCLAASKQDTEVITPFRVAALMSKNCSHAQNTKQQTNCIEIATISAGMASAMNGENPDVSVENIKENGGTQPVSEKMNSEVDISDTESLIRMEDHRHQTEILMKRFRNSEFFVRISEFGEPLWSKRNVPKRNHIGSMKTSNTVIDGEIYDGDASGGMSRSIVKCCPLRNGDIVVLLEVNVGSGNLKDPVLEVLQFEKYPLGNLSSENNQTVTTRDDSCEELLSWLLPLDQSLPITHPSSHPLVSGTNVRGNVSHRSTLSSSSSSQLFSFSHFRSYSLPSVPQSALLSSPISNPSDSKPTFDLEEYNFFTEESKLKNTSPSTRGLRSFRGVPLEPERYSIQCGLGGIYIPGKRWRRKLEIIQPIEIKSFSAECNAEDILCVQIKNIFPENRPDIIIYVDAISIVFEESPKSGQLLSVPLSCVDAGNDHFLPNLALRRGEEHSFILKPATMVARDLKSIANKSSPLQPHLECFGTNGLRIPKNDDENDASEANKYAVLVSFRCNFSESKLFLKKPTSWRPCVMTNLLISVASEVTEQSSGPGRGSCELPFQAFTLQVTNLSNEDLNLTVLAPASVTAPPSVVSLNSAPESPVSPIAGFPEFMERITEDKLGNTSLMQRNCSMPMTESQKDNINGGLRSVSFNERTVVAPDVIPNPEFGCTHLWLKSTIPLGHVPPRSSAKVKLELLPLTDGIITLDTLQIVVAEKGQTYVPECPLKIHATSSIATGIV